MLSETAARFVYPNEDPLGRPIPYGDIDPLDIAGWESPVIAVVDDMKYEGLAAPRAGSLYAQRRSVSGSNPRFSLAAREQWCTRPSGPFRVPSRDGRSR